MHLPLRVANRLAQAGFDGLEAELEHCLQLVGGELGLSLLSLARHEPKALSTTHQWRGIGQMDPAFEIDLDRARWFRDQIEAGEDIIIDDTTALPSIASFESEYLGARMTGALVALAGGQGDATYLVAEMQRDPRIWSSEELAVLVEVAQHLSAALAHHREQRMLVLSAREAGLDSEAKSRFIATLAHELRTPLTAIIGYSQLLSSAAVGEMNEKQRRFVGDILSCAEHLERIVNESLDLAMLDSSRMTLTIDEHDARALVGSAVLSVRAQAEAAGLELRVALPDEDINIHADDVKVRQILINLLTNAIKFTSEGTVELELVTEPETIVFVVRDTGRGIARGNQQRIFDSFSRVHRSSSKDEGTGLGLALVSRLVALHGGEIAVDSALDHGSVFTVRLPRRARSTTTGRPVSIGAETLRRGLM